MSNVALLFCVDVSEHVVCVITAFRQNRHQRVSEFKKNETHRALTCPCWCVCGFSVIIVYIIMYVGIIIHIWLPLMYFLLCFHFAIRFHHHLVSLLVFFLCFSFQVGDLVLIILDERHDNYVLFTVGPTLYFLHSESLTALDLKPGQLHQTLLSLALCHWNLFYTFLF